MTFAKKLGLKLLAAVFVISMFGVGVSTATNSVFGTPDRLKDSLSEGKAYEAITDSIVAQISKESASQPGVQFTSKAAKTAVSRAVKPDVIQQNIEKMIDGTYDWLDGTAETPTFAISTTSIQDQVAKSVSDAAYEHVKKLPPCRLNDYQQVNLDKIDPFTLKCQPQGVNLTFLRELFEAEIANGYTNQQLSDQKLTAQDFKNDQGQNVFEQAEEIPQAFQFGQKLPWIFGILAALSAVGIIFLHETRRRGLKSLSIALLIAGIALLVTMLVSSLVLGVFKPAVDGGDVVAIQDATVAVIKSLASALNRVLLVFAAAYVVLGAAGLIGLRLTKPKNDAHAYDSEPAEQKEVIENTETKEKPEEPNTKDNI